MNIQAIKRVLLLVGFIMTVSITLAQNREVAQQTINTLCGEDFSGRGYINKGDSVASAYIAKRMKDIGLQGYSSDFLNPFVLNVNTFNTTQVKVDQKDLRPGFYFLVAPEAKSAKGNYKVFYVSPKLLSSPKAVKKVKSAIKKGFVPVLCSYEATNKVLAENAAKIKKSLSGATFIQLKSSLTWSVAKNQSKNTEIELLDSVFDRYASEINITIEANFIKNYASQNVIGYVPGAEKPDSFIILCAHYDHLGKMGEAIFYGANDNASGIATMLDLATYFVDHPQRYSLVFIAFGAEEAGLIGSLNYVRQPTVPLVNTRFVFNMDLMGSGDKGATIVNGSIYKNEYEALTKINTENDYLPLIKSRGKAANSDHYYFTEAGVPSFFIYLMGDYTFYHSPNDSPKNLHLGQYYDRSFQLIRDFIIYLN